MRGRHGPPLTAREPGQGVSADARIFDDLVIDAHIAWIASAYSSPPVCRIIRTLAGRHGQARCAVRDVRCESALRFNRTLRPIIVRQLQDILCRNADAAPRRPVNLVQQVMMSLAVGRKVHAIRRDICLDDPDRPPGVILVPR